MKIMNKFNNNNNNNNNTSLNILLFGITGTGKSSFLNSILTSLLP